MLLEAQKQQSALQLFARAVVLAPDHEMDPERFSPFVRAGFASMYFDLIAPFDNETVERLAGEVWPELKRLV